MVSEILLQEHPIWSASCPDWMIRQYLYLFYGRACAEVMVVVTWSIPKWRCHPGDFLTLQWQKCKYLLSYTPSTTVIKWTRQVWTQFILEWGDKTLIMCNFFTKCRQTGKNTNSGNCVMADINRPNSQTLSDFVSISWWDMTIFQYSNNKVTFVQS